MRITKEDWENLITVLDEVEDKSLEEQDSIAKILSFLEVFVVKE